MPTTVTTSCVLTGNSIGNFYFDNPATSGDDAKLLDDCQDVGNGGVPSTLTWTFAGLMNGCYDVYVYAWAPDNATCVTFVEDPSSPGVGTVVGGNYTGTLVQGAQYAVYPVQVTTGMLMITVTSNGATANFGSVNGFQFKMNTTTCSTTTGTSFCFGDGTATACPCGNPGTAGNGCASSVNSAGGTLSATGSPQVSNDTVAFVQSFAGGAILTMLATTMMPEAFENGGARVGIATTLGFSTAYAVHVFG